MQLTSVKIWSATACIQAGWVASSPRVWKRTPQRANSPGIAPSPNTTTSPPPLILYPSESTVNRPPQDSLPSPSIKSPTIILAALAGAGAISAITLTFFFIYRKYKTASFQKFTTEVSTSSNEKLGLKKGRSKVKKYNIRHITHEAQKERYKSVFGVPAGYLRPKSQISIQEPRRSHQNLRHSQYLPNSGQVIVDNGDSVYPSEDSISNGGILPHQVTPQIDTLDHEGGRERKSVAFKFDQDSTPKIHHYTTNGDAVKSNYFSQRFSHLPSRLRSIKDKAFYKGQSLNQSQILTESNEKDIIIPIQLDAMREEVDVPRSPSIVATPPSYLKSPYHLRTEFEKPVDLGALVTERLQHKKESINRTSFEGRGDSYYWKVSPILHSPDN